MGISLNIIIGFLTYFPVAVSASLTLEPGESEGSATNATCVNAPVHLRTRDGDSVKIHCRYNPGEPGGTKTFCREDGNAGCTALISASRAKHTRLPSISLTDEEEEEEGFMVSFSSVTPGDAGRYRCLRESFEKQIVQCLTEIELFILTDAYSQSTAPEPSPPSGLDVRDASANLGWTGGIVGSLALLVVFAVALLLVRYKFLTPRGNPEDPNDEEMQMERRLASSGDALRSVNASVKASPHQQHYSSIDFRGSVSTLANENPLFDPNENVSSPCDYTIIRKPESRPSTQQKISPIHVQ